MRLNDLALGTLLVLTMVAPRALAAAGEIDLTVDDPRPVAKAMEQLSSRFGYVITYEDPRYAYADDLRDVTSEVRKDLAKYPAGGAPKVLVPAGGFLSMRYAGPMESDRPADPGTIVQQVLDVQASRSNGGTFQLERTGDVLHIVPASVRDKNGEVVPQHSVLDVAITIPGAQRDALSMVDEICTAVSRASGEKVVLGTVPLNQLMRVSAQLGAKDERARDVLLRTLEDTHATLVWSLLYAPDGETHYLNLRQVQTPVSAAQQPPPPKAPSDRPAVAPRGTPPK